MHLNRYQLHALNEIAATYPQGSLLHLENRKSTPHIVVEELSRGDHVFVIDYFGRWIETTREEVPTVCEYVNVGDL